DAAVALVDHREVVDEAVGDRNAARRVGAGAVDEERNEDRAALREGGGRERSRGQREDQHGDDGVPEPHGSVSFMRRKRGIGHSRSFSFVTCQSRARPCGSTIRKKRISPPNTISSICFWSATGRWSPTAWGALVRKMGTSTMNAAPRNEPSTLPSP